MPHFNALWSFKSDDDVLLDEEAELFKGRQSPYPLTAAAQDVATFHIATDTPTDIPALHISPNPSTNVIPFDANAALPSYPTIAYQHNSLPLQNISTTQSLVAALHATMDPHTTRPVLVIPAEMKRLPRTEALMRPQQRMRLHLRHSLVVATTFLVLLMALLSLSPLGSGESGIPLFDGVVQWVQTAQPSWNIVAHTLPTSVPPPAAADVAPQTNTNTASTILPTGNYVAIARQAAVSAGIPADAFVRQIQQESSFNPYAVSPVGAVGIAQFLPSTAAGLGINPYDPVSALYGAARYMASLSAQFGGNYSMGLAAYNAGSGAVQSAVNRGGADWLYLLPLETQNYVLKIMG